MRALKCSVFLASGKSDLQCKIKETLLISEFKPLLNENVDSEKLFLDNNNNNNLFAFPFEIRLQEIYIYFLFFM